MQWMKRHLSTIIIVSFLVAGLLLLIYPSASDYWNSFHQSRAIASYAEAVAEIDDNRYARIWQEAERFNLNLQHEDPVKRWFPSEREQQNYEEILNIGGNGIMGYIEIPGIQVSLPIYHGTDDAVLQIAIGHIEGSSLPVGGEGTHSVLSGHRGLPSARLFTDLNLVEEGDVFYLRILDETLTYEVDQIRIVEPADMTFLEIEPDRDLCTLVTCTPYGINSHRMLVRGHRIENEAETRGILRVTADAVQIEPMLAAPIMAVPMLLILMAALFAGTGLRRRHGKTVHWSGKDYRIR